jgi:P-type Ca2+ transporter type 2C
MAVSPFSIDDLRRWQQLDPATLAAQPPDDALHSLGSTPDGLSSADAAIRLQALGSGEFGVGRGLRGGVALLAIVVRPLLLPLWIAAIIAFAIDRDYTGQALLAAAALNTLVAAFQERKAERATAALYDDLPSFARVLRDGREQHILATMVAPGDILLLGPNDILSADARVIESEGLHTANPVLRSDDSVLHKTADAVPADDVRGTELPNMVYAGGQVVSGRGRAVVIATGLGTAYGQIAALTQQAQEEPSPLLLAFTRLGTLVLTLGVIGAVGGYLVAVDTFGLTVHQGLTVAILFLTAAVPTGLMPGITLALIEGARRLQARQAIFRRLSSVETLGATTVICVDKTGTLTQNEMTVRELWTADATLDVSGVGYQPCGEFSSEGRPVDQAAVQTLGGVLMQAAVLTSTARLLPPDTFRPQWHIVGDPVEAAYLAVAAKAGMKADRVYERVPQLAVLNSDRHTALDGVIVEEDRQPVVYIKGAVGDVLARCTAIATVDGDRAMTDRDRQTVKRTLQRYSRDAMRTVAFARRAVSRDEANAITIDAVAHDLVLLGLIAVVDPPREEVTSAINDCHAARIRTIMLTGDDTLSAASLARRCQLIPGAQQRVISGPELDTLDDAALRDQLRSGDMVLARLTPEQKVRVVRTLEALGEVVVVTGSAASDVPALKAAYTGIAMGATGSPAARQAADLVLLDDNFATISNAILEGRAVEQRVRRLVALNLATTVVKLTALVVSLAAGLPLLLTVGQQLLIDFLAGLLPGLAIGAGQPDPRLMQRPPRPTGRPLLSRKVFGLGYGFWGLIAAGLAVLAVLLYVLTAREQAGVFANGALLGNNLQSYEQRIATPEGVRGLVATTLYVVVGVAALLGAAIVPRAARPRDRGPRLLLGATVALSFMILIATIEWEPVHRYIALIDIPRWGWLAAVGALLIVALLEFLRQRFDPIYKPQIGADRAQRLPNVPSAKQS